MALSGASEKDLVPPVESLSPGHGGGVGIDVADPPPHEPHLRVREIPRHLPQGVAAIEASGVGKDEDLPRKVRDRLAEIGGLPPPPGRNDQPDSPVGVLPDHGVGPVGGGVGSDGHRQLFGGVLQRQAVLNLLPENGLLVVGTDDQIDAGSDVAPPDRSRTDPAQDPQQSRVAEVKIGQEGESRPEGKARHGLNHASPPLPRPSDPARPSRCTCRQTALRAMTMARGVRTRLPLVRLATRVNKVMASHSRR